jgi:hypothetical protein
MACASLQGGELHRSPAAGRKRAAAADLGEALAALEDSGEEGEEGEAEWVMAPRSK